MGRIYDCFSNLVYENEADVSLKFTIPLLTSFLGFLKTDIIPEHDYPARDLFYGRRKLSTKDLPESQRPDFVVCLGSLDKACYVVDSKAPTENLDNHLDQLKSYSLGAKVNFLVITNGTALRIYYGQEEILNLTDLMQLDIFFPIVLKLLSKEVHLKNTPLQIIQALDLQEINKTKKDLTNTSKGRIRLEISDYFQYLSALEKELEEWHFPNDFARSLGISKFSPSELHSFRMSSLKEEESVSKILTARRVLDDFDSRVKIIHGPSGIGKTTLLRFWGYTQAKKCIDLVDATIPVLVELRNFGLNRSIRSLVKDSLNKRGCVPQETMFKEDLVRKRFIFLLDAFDEIPEEYKKDALSEIVEFTETFPQQRFIISSRIGRELRMPAALSFEVLSLSREIMETIIEMNLGPRKNDFIQQLYQCGLINELNNTLLLVLAIHLYQSERIIPATRTKIIEQIVKQVENWEETKITRHETRISWKVKMDLLKKIAFSMKENAYGLTFPENLLGSLLAKQIRDYEKAKEVPEGLDKLTLLKELATTGFIRHDDFGLTFNATIFLDHFAALKLSELFGQSPTILRDKMDKVLWHQVIIASTSKVSNPNVFVRDVYQKDLIKSAACLVENQNVDEELVKEIVRDLETNCGSKFPTVRNRSIYYLARIEKKYTQDVFKRLLTSKHVFIRMMAIEELSKNADSQAIEVVNENIGWDEGGLMIGDTTQGAIARALANLNDEKSHLQIVDIWKKKVDMFTTEDCKNAMISLVYRKKLTPAIRDALLDWFLSKPIDEDTSFFSKLMGIASVLITLEDESIIHKLIQGFDIMDDYKFTRRREISKILASFKSPSTLKILVDGSLNQKNSTPVRAGLSEALSKTNNFKVDLSVFVKLLSDKDPMIRREAVIGLSKFSSYEVKDLLLQLVNDPDIHVHSEAISLLGDFGLLSIISEEKRFPKLFDSGMLFSQIRKHDLTEFLPILDKIKRKWTLKEEKDQLERQLIDLAHTYLVLGKIDQTYNILDIFYVDGKICFQNSYAYASLADLCSIIGGEIGVKILEDIFQAIQDARASGSTPKLFDSIFMDEAYIENLQKIGSVRAIEILMQLCEKYADEKDVKSSMLFERAMRAIVSLAPKSKEDWLIELIRSHPELKGPDLHRAVEALGVLGTDKSIPLIKKIANDNKGSEYILDICLTAMEYINLKKGIVKFLEDSDVLET